MRFYNVFKFGIDEGNIDMEFVVISICEKMWVIIILDDIDWFYLKGWLNRNNKF